MPHIDEVRLLRKRAKSFFARARTLKVIFSHDDPCVVNREGLNFWIDLA
jgi:hypothetical protein